MAAPLAEMLTAAGARVWLDQHELQIGDSLSEEIDKGLSRSRYGVVILSKPFIKKHWTKKELSGLRALEETRKGCILPVWHGVTKEEMTRFTPTIADIVAASTEKGLSDVASSILSVIFASSGSISNYSLKTNKTLRRRLIELLDKNPSRLRLLSFLSANLSRSMYFAHKDIKITEFNFCGIHFDGYDQCGNSVAKGHHGFVLSCHLFTEIWGDPYEARSGDNGMLEVNRELSQTISAISSIISLIRNYDQVTTNQAISEYCKLIGYDLKNSQGARFDDLSFNIYAGRRKFIDMTPERHSLWTKTRSEFNDYTLVTYDNLISMFT